MKICIIGDSHIAAMILGWKQAKHEWPETQITFLGAPGEAMKDLIVSRGSLVPSTEELRRSLMLTSPDAEVVADYDWFLICGLKLRLSQIRPLYRKYRAERFANDDRIPISDECFIRSLQGALRETPAVATALKVKQITSAPIGLIPQPLPGEERTPRSGWLDRAQRRGDAKGISELFDDACSRVARDLDAVIVFQPPVTKSGPVRTKLAYSQGSIRLRNLAKQHRDREVFHMNAEYGSIVLRQALGRLSRHNDGARS